MTPFLFLLAQQPASPDAGPMGSMLVPMVLMMAMMYFLMIRPQQKRQKELEKQIEAIKVGDLVVTTGGLHGMVANKGDKVITLKVAENVRLKFDLNAIARVSSKGAAEAPVIEG
jgi:preprotein translocase subunit YajC